jgi:hypothetical protein
MKREEGEEGTMKWACRNIRELAARTSLSVANSRELSAAATNDGVVFVLLSLTIFFTHEHHTCTTPSDKFTVAIGNFLRF